MQSSRAVGRANPESISRARGKAHSALSLPGRLAGNLVGTAIVLACVTLPFVLGALADSTEIADERTDIQSLRATAGPPARTLTAAKTTARAGHLLDQSYYFVNGCVAAPRDCASADASDWGEYYAELQRLYSAARKAVYGPAETFDAWAREHTHFIKSQIAPGGASEIEEALAENSETGDIHIVGTSAGGAAIFTYLSEAMRGDVPLDKRIRSVMTVDSPLGRHPSLVLYDLINGVQASAMKTDVEPGIGAWTEAAGITILTVNSREDLVGYDPVPGVANDPGPTYSQHNTPPRPAFMACSLLPCEVAHLEEYLDLGSTWHIYTGSHLANSARQFIDKHWR